MAINKSDIVNQLKKSYPNLLKKDIEKLISVVLNEIKRALKRGDSCEIRGFGRFSPRIQKARLSRNPATGETIQIAAKNAPAFKAAKGLKDSLN